MGFDASEAPGQFYQCHIDNLYSGMNLYFSYWLASTGTTNSYPHKTNQIIRMEDTNGVPLALYYTGNTESIYPGFSVPVLL
jgi:hypothetical protein